MAEADVTRLFDGRNIDDLPKSFKEAKAKGDRWYFTGKPCNHGHIAARFVSSCGSCVTCSGLRSRKWVEDNRERALSLARARTAKYVATHPEAKDAWRKGDKEAARARVRNRRALKRNSEGRHTPADIARIRKAQKDRCAMPDCRSKLGGCGHVDHIKSLKRGGSNAARNLQLLCGPCNQTKHARDPIEFAQSRGLLI
jgi:5-methylcytosine-specific restriction endonuclease McrA